MIQLWHMKKNKLAAIFVGICLVCPVFCLANFDTLIQEKEKEREVVKDKIETYQAQVTEKKKEAKTLSDELAVYDAQIEESVLQITDTDIVINEININIDKRKAAIAEMEAKVGREKTVISECIRKMYEYDQESLLEIILKKEDFSDFFVEVNNIDIVNKQLVNSVEELRALRKKTEKEQAGLETDKEEQLQIRAMQDAQKQYLNGQKYKRDQLLAYIKKEERNLNGLITDNANALSQINSQIYYLQSLGDSISFDDAVSAAEYAAGLTGARKAYLLGILKVESNLGANVGRGTYLVDMKPSNRDTFVAICEGLGLDPANMPVSKKPTSYSGWGGAMGPAQMMPKTWLGYVDRVAALTGHNPPNPWNLQDALVGMAVKVSGIAGVTSHDYNAEYKAAAIYFAGSNWKRFTWYADRVMEYTGVYQQGM